MSPKLYLWQYYDQNPDNLTEDKLIDWYIKGFYKLRLMNLNPFIFLNTLNEKFSNEIILLCHELSNSELNKEHFCHRRLLADWIELETRIIIPEISIDENAKTIQEEIYDIKPKIKKIIPKYKPKKFKGEKDEYRTREIWKNCLRSTIS